MRPIDADALLEAAKASLKYETNPKWELDELQDLITNAPTVQREGWVSVPVEPTEEMIAALKSALKEWKNDEECYKAMISAAPTDTEQRR